MTLATSFSLGTVPPAAQLVTWLEILPVFVEAGAIWWLRPNGEESWRLCCEGDCPVREAVCRSLVEARVEAVAVHSTSWRQDGCSVVLTHLAVLHAPTETVPGFERVRVRRRDLARGTAIRPPRLIEVEQVVEHALRHLAWLRVEDPHVRAAIERGWSGPLAGYRPEPFRVS